MLTGDNERSAGAIARRVGVDEYRAQLLPTDKVDAVKQLKQQYGTADMVGAARAGNRRLPPLAG